MKNIIKYTWIILIFISCNETLEEEIVTGITADSHYSTPAGIEDAVKATYSFARDFHMGSGTDVRAYGLTEAGTDIYRVARGYNPLHTYDENLNSSIPEVESTWQILYQGINVANAVINRAPEVDLADNVKNQRIAEARFLRAYFYYHLVQTYGEVHLTTEETVGVEVEATRTPESQIYQEVIIPDLEFAAGNLPVEQDDFGRVTKPAAEALLTRVYMIMEDWGKTEELAKNLIEDYDFEISDSYKAIWDGYSLRNDEIIWSIQFSLDPLVPGQNMGSVYFTPWYTREAGVNPSPANDGTWVRFRPTPFLINLFDRDVDRRYTEGFKDVWYANTLNGAPAGMAIGDTALYYSPDTLSAEYKESKNYKIYDIVDQFSVDWAWPQTYKVRNDWRTSFSERRAKDIIILRISEIYLNLVEALYRQNKIDEAVEYLNTLRRKRAFDGKEDEMEILASQLDMEFILDERARELFAEGTRWYTLKRTGTLVERVRKYNAPAAPFIQPFHTVRPIPLTQLDRTANEYAQNEGYN